MSNEKIKEAKAQIFCAFVFCKKDESYPERIVIAENAEVAIQVFCFLHENTWQNLKLQGFYYSKLFNFKRVGNRIEKIN